MINIENPAIMPDWNNIVKEVSNIELNVELEKERGFTFDTNIGLWHEFFCYKGFKFKISILGKYSLCSHQKTKLIHKWAILQFHVDDEFTHTIKHHYHDFLRYNTHACIESPSFNNINEHLEVVFKRAIKDINSILDYIRKDITIKEDEISSLRRIYFGINGMEKQ